MRTATVRALRNQYTTLLRWMSAGEEILITRRGKPVARLVPEGLRVAKTGGWAQSAAVKRDRSGERVLSARQSAALRAESGGAW